MGGAGAANALVKASGRWLRAPALHFVCIGALLYSVDGARRDSAPEAPPEAIVITAEQVAQLRGAFSRATGRRPDPREEAALIADARDEEILFREARARGLDRVDASVRRRLIQNMRFLRGDGERSDKELLAEALELGLDENDTVVRRILVRRMRREAGLEEGLGPSRDAAPTIARARHEALPLFPPRVRLTQIFLSRDQRRASLERDARDLARALRSRHLSPESSPNLGERFSDASLLPHDLGWSSERELARLFGREFASQVMALEVGRWSEPIASTYGLHVVGVRDRADERPAPVEQVKARLRYASLAAQRRERLEAMMQRLRPGYEVRVEDREWP